MAMIGLGTAALNIDLTTNPNLEITPAVIEAWAKQGLDAKGNPVQKLRLPEKIAGATYCKDLPPCGFFGDKKILENSVTGSEQCICETTLGTALLTPVRLFCDAVDPGRSGMCRGGDMLGGNIGMVGLVYYAGLAWLAYKLLGKG